MIIKDVDQLFTKTGKINSAIVRREWFLESDFFKHMIRSTDFLAVDSSILKRVHAIKFKLSSHPICKHCGATKWIFNK